MTCKKSKKRPESVNCSQATAPRACVQMWDPASGLVQVGKMDPAWAMGAREILFGLLLHIKKTQPGLTVEQVIQEAERLVPELDYDDLVKIVAREHPPAEAFLMGRTSKATAGFLVQLAVSLSPARRCSLATSRFNL